MATSSAPTETQLSASGNNLENQSIRERLKRHRIVVATIGVLIIAAAIEAGLTLKSSQDTRSAEVAAQSAAVAAAEQEAARIDEEKRTQEAADSRARLSRSLSVIQIESGIKTMAENTSQQD